MNEEIRNKYWRDPGFYLSLLFMAYVVVLMVLSFGYPSYRARVFPLIVGFISLPMILVDVLGKIYPGIGKRMESLRGGKILETNNIEAGSKERGDKEKLDTKTLLTLFFWFSGCFVLFFLFGYLISVAAFLFFFLKFFSSCRLVSAIEVTAAVTLVVFVIFTIVLDLPVIW